MQGKAHVREIKMQFRGTTMYPMCHHMHLHRLPDIGCGFTALYANRFSYLTVNRLGQIQTMFAF